MRCASLMLTITCLLSVFAWPSRGQDAIAHIESRGDGPIAMILIPGSPSDWRVWDTFMTRNIHRYTMHALTLAGFSGTPALPMPPAADPAHAPDGAHEAVSPTPWLDAAVDSIARFIAERELNNAVVIGHSLGGHLALRLAIEHPGLASRIIDIDGVPSSNVGAPGMTPDMRIAFVDAQIAPQLRALSAEEAVAVIESSAHQMVTDAKRADEIASMFAMTDHSVAIEYLIEGLRSDITPRIAAITTPTLIIAAIGQARDNLAARDTIRTQWRTWTRGIDPITLIEFEDAMHFVMDDQPAKLDEAIATFLDAAASPADPASTP